MEIKVLGSGCSKCKKLHDTVKNAVSELQIEANVLYITDIKEIANSGLLSTPGLIINGKIVLNGRVPSLEEVKTIIRNRV